MERSCYNEGTSYDERIPERYVIFLTRHDLIGLGFPLYHFEWTLQEAPTAQLHERFKPREHIIYINGALKEEGTLLGDLVHDFYCKEAKDVRNPVLRERVRYLKEDEKGVKEMSEAMEKYTKEAREEAWAEGEARGRAEGRTEGAAKERRDLIRTMLRNGISAEELAKGVGVSVDEIRKMQTVVLE